MGRRILVRDIRNPCSRVATEGAHELDSVANIENIAGGPGRGRRRDQECNTSCNECLWSCLQIHVRAVPLLRKAIAPALSALVRRYVPYGNGWYLMLVNVIVSTTRTIRKHGAIWLLSNQIY